MTLAEQIKQAREAKNYSQEDLANQLGVSRQAISKWENGNAEPHGVNREMLNQILGLTLSVDGEDIKNELESIKKRIKQRNIAMICLIIICIVFAMLFIASINKHDKPAEIAAAPSNTEQPAKEEKPGPEENDTVTFAPRTSNEIESIVFYDKDANTVDSVALWYNMALIDYMIVSWKGDIPQTVEVYITPTGTETIEEKELVITKAVTFEKNSMLISLKELKREDLMDHMTVVLNYGETMISTDIINVIYDENEPELHDLDYFNALITAVSDIGITADKVNWVHLNGASAEGKETVEDRYYIENDAVDEQSYEFADNCFFSTVNHEENEFGMHELIFCDKEEFISTVSKYIEDGRQYAFIVTILDGKISDIAER